MPCLGVHVHRGRTLAVATSGVDELHGMQGGLVATFVDIYEKVRAGVTPSMA